MIILLGQNIVNTLLSFTLKLTDRNIVGLFGLNGSDLDFELIVYP